MRNQALIENLIIPLFVAWAIAVSTVVVKLEVDVAMIKATASLERKP